MGCEGGVVDVDLEKREPGRVLGILVRRELDAAGFRIAGTRVPCE
jgi:hypothetical protein